MKTQLALAAFVSIAMSVALAAGPQGGRAPAGQSLLGAGSVPTASPLVGADAFFDDSTVHEIRLAINAKDWQTLKDNYLDNTYYPADFRWRDQIVRNAGIRSRGNGSRSGVKPGLRIDFDRYTSDQKFLGLKSFVLRNNTQDPTSMRERLSMLLFRRMGLPAPREAHTKMYVNDAYAGLFTLVEAVDKDFLKRNFGENAGYLYKYDYPPDQTPYRFEDRGSDSAQYVPLPFKPETYETAPRPEFIVQLVQTVNQASTVAFQTAVGEYLNLQKFLRHVAVEVFLGDYDGFIGNYGINNFYLYRPDNQKLFTFIAWDKSEAFQAGPTSSIFHNINDVPEAQRNHLMTRALSIPDLYNSFLDALLECARSVSEPAPGDSRGWLEREVQKEYGQIRDPQYADTGKPFSNESFEQNVAALVDFAQRRSALVTAEVNASRR